MRIVKVFHVNKMIDSQIKTARLFPSVLALCCILNIYNLANYEISIDDEYHFLGDKGVWIWWVKISRWGAALIQAISPNAFVVPFSTTFAFCLALAATYCLLCEMHQVKKRWQALFLLPLFAVFPSFAHIESFYSVLPAVSVGLLLTAGAAFLTNKALLTSARHASWFNWQAFFCLTIAIGCYQSFVLLYFALGIGTALAAGQLSGNDQNRLFSRRPIVVYVLTSIASIAAYAVIGKSTQLVLNIEPDIYLDAMLPSGWYLPWNWPRNIFIGLRSMIKYYTGMPAAYGQSFYSFFALIGLAFFSFWFANWNKRSKNLNSLALYVVLLASPFAFSFLGGGLPMRSLLSLPYVAWLSGLLLLRACTSKRAKLLILSGFAIISIVNLQIISINGAYAGASWLASSHDEALASEIYSRLSKFYVDSPPPKPIKIFITGRIRYQTLLPGGDTIGASFFDWDNGNQSRMIGYMRLLGYTEIAPLKDGVVGRLKNKIRAMPEWPAQGAVAKVGPDSFVIKLKNAI